MRFISKSGGYESFLSEVAWRQLTASLFRFVFTHTSAVAFLFLLGR